MLRKAIFFIIYHRKSTAIVVLLISLAVFLLTSVPALFSALKEKTFEGYVQEYGKHHAVFFDLSEQQVQALQQAEEIESLGLFYNYGSYSLLGAAYKMTLGYYDETAFSLASLSVLEGRLPEASNEIALEEHFQYQFSEKLTIGSRLRIETQDGEKEFEVCGFIKDYRAYRNELDLVEEGYTDFPGGLVSKTNDLQIDGVVNAVLYMHSLNKMEMPQSAILDLSERIELGKGKQRQQWILFNDMTYWISSYGTITAVNVYERLFTVLIFVGAAILLWILLWGYWQPYRQTAGTLYSLGASSRTVACILLWGAALLAIAGLLGGTVLRVLFLWLMQDRLDAEIPAAGYWLPYAVMFGLVVGVSFAYGWFCIFRLKKAAFSVKRAKRDKQFSLGKRVVFSLAKLHIRRNAKRILSAGLILVMLITMFFCIQYDYLEKQAQLQAPDTFRAASKAGGALQFYGELELSVYDIDAFYPLEAVQKLDGLAGVEEVQKQYGGIPASLVFPEGGSYYNEIQSRYSVANLGKSAQEVEAIPENLRATRDGYSIWVLDEQKLSAFESAYPEIDVQTDLAKGQAILFCAAIPTPGGYVAAVENNVFEGGQTLRFGMLKTQASFLEATNDTTKIEYVEETLFLSKVYNEEFRLEDTSNGKIIVVITEETAAQTNFLSTVSVFRLTLEKEISEETYAAVQEAFYQVAATIPGANIYESRKDKAFQRALIDTLGIVYTTVAGILGLFMLFSIASILYQSLLRRQKMFGILRATGYTQAMLLKTVFLELMAYFGVIVVLSAAASFYAVSRFSLEVVGPQISQQGYYLLFQGLLWYAGALLLLFTALAMWITRSVFKQNIASCIRFSE